jgi:rSAM/selenodomain-associated transferase 1
VSGTPLYLFAKAPDAGRVKRRMCPPLDAKQAAQVATAMLAHTSAVVERGWLGRKVLNVAPDLSHAAFLSYQEGMNWQTRVQVQAGLGERMREVLLEGIESSGSAVVLGTDIPTLDATILKGTYHALQSGNSVVGPSQDGGFYLLGLRDMPAGLFNGIEWGGAWVYARLMKNARELCMDLQPLTTLSDCDYFEDLKLAAQTVPEFDTILRRAGSEKWLQNTYPVRLTRR